MNGVDVSLCFTELPYRNEADQLEVGQPVRCAGEEAGERAAGCRILNSGQGSRCLRRDIDRRAKGRGNRGCEGLI